MISELNRSDIHPASLSMRPFIIAVINQKGGVGKTTTTLNLGAAHSEAGHASTLLDLDLQRDLSSFAPRRRLTCGSGG
jgi:cellulose biosynthesis protein BcsQ